MTHLNSDLFRNISPRGGDGWGGRFGGRWGENAGGGGGEGDGEDAAGGGVGAIRGGRESCERTRHNGTRVGEAFTGCG